VDGFKIVMMASYLEELKTEHQFEKNDLKHV
jgi:hypothetical protein